MMSPPCFQSHRKPSDQRFQVKSLENDIWNVGFASPTTTTLPVESSPTICVADFPCSIWKAPSAVPKPPTWKAGTGRFSTRLLFVKKLVRINQLMVGVRTGESSKDSSRP